MTYSLQSPVGESLGSTMSEMNNFLFYEVPVDNLLIVSVLSTDLCFDMEA